MKELEWEKELLKIISKKHGGGLGLCDTMYNKTIIPYFKNLLKQQKLKAIDEKIELLENLKIDVFENSNTYEVFDEEIKDLQNQKDILEKE